MHGEEGSGPKSDRSDAVTRALHVTERGLVIAVAIMTVIAALLEIARVVDARSVTLADILLMFLYAEVLGMAAVFYSSVRVPVAYPIFIAMTALARLIVLQGKDMDPANILFEAGAILLLAIAVVVLGHARRE